MSGSSAPLTSSMARENAAYGSIPSVKEQIKLLEQLQQQQQEQDSLVGEELVPTDAEEEEDALAASAAASASFPNGHGNGKGHGNRNRDSNGSEQYSLTYSDGRGESTIATEGNGEDGVCGHLVRHRVLYLLLALTAAGVLFSRYSRTPKVKLGPYRQTKIPFTSVFRGNYGDAVQNFINIDLIHPNLVSKSGPRAFSFPFPTGAFWTNLVVVSPDGRVSYPVAVYPYAYKWSDSSVQLSYPANHRWTTPLSISDPFVPDLTFGTRESNVRRFIMGFDPLSTTLRYLTSSQGRWDVILVQGSPYATLRYESATPHIWALSIFEKIQCPRDYGVDDSLEADDEFTETSGDRRQRRRRLFGVCAVDQTDDTHIVLRGVQFLLKSQEGADWIMFVSEPIELVFDRIRKTTVYTSKPFTGIIRIAHIPPKDVAADDDFVTVSASTGLRRLIYHAGEYPVGASVSWDFHSTSSSSSTSTSSNLTTTKAASVHFTFDTQTMTDSGRSYSKPKGLLMMALPHHAKVLPESSMLRSDRFDLTYTCIKGPMTPVVGSVWTYDEPLLDLGLDDHHGAIDDGVRKLILDQVQKDLDRVLPTRTENIYGFGKQTARLAQLAHITRRLTVASDRTNRTSTEFLEDERLLNRSSTLLLENLDLLLTSAVSDRLVYDENLGGIVSINGLMNTGEDFGNGRYNDHHFHYGYILYACAIMARLDPSFVQKYGSYVDVIYYDVAYHANTKSHDSNRGTFFPFTRHKSWFDGHSFATGMFSFGDGKSQESSSEAVNCYYGAYLWTLVRHDDSQSPINSDIVEFARLLLAMEIRGAKTYWHMVPPVPNTTQEENLVYSRDFSDTFMVGNVGMLDVAINTWFGSSPLYVHMINALPITAVTSVLFGEEYTQQEYPFLIESVGGSIENVEMAWRGYVASIHAIIDPNTAWEEAQSIVSYELDSALSKSQVLYWISTRPGFNVTITDYDDDDTNTNDSSGSASCESHDQCQTLGVSGDCCPTGDGIFLSCCTN